MDKLEQRIGTLEIHMDKRFNELKPDMQGFMYWGFGILFSGFFILFGFVLWDRRTTLVPVVKETKDIKAIIDVLQKDDQAVKTILKEYAKENESFAKIMNKAALF